MELVPDKTITDEILDHETGVSMIQEHLFHILKQIIVLTNYFKYIFTRTSVPLEN